MKVKPCNNCIRNYHKKSRDCFYAVCNTSSKRWLSFWREDSGEEENGLESSSDEEDRVMVT